MHFSILARARNERLTYVTGLHCIVFTIYSAQAGI